MCLFGAFLVRSQPNGTRNGESEEIIENIWALNRLSSNDNRLCLRLWFTIWKLCLFKAKQRDRIEIARPTMYRKRERERAKSKRQMYTNSLWGVIILDESRSSTGFPFSKSFPVCVSLCFESALARGKCTGSKHRMFRKFNSIFIYFTTWLQFNLFETSNSR